MSNTRDTNPSQLVTLPGLLLEFREKDKTLSQKAVESLNFLEMLPPPRLSDSHLLETLTLHLKTLKENPDGLWTNIISNKGDLSETINSINRTLGSPVTNEKYKKRFAACYWIAQHYLEQLLPALERAEGSQTRTFERLSSSLAGIFQFLPHQALLISDLFKKIEIESPENQNAITSLSSLNRKYKRLNTFMNLTLDVLNGRETSEALAKHAQQSNRSVIGIALEASHLLSPTHAGINNDSSTIITSMLESNDNDNLPTDQQWGETLHALDESMIALEELQRPQNNEQEDHKASIDSLETISSRYSTRITLELPVDPAFLTPTPTDPETRAKAAIKKLKDTLAEETRPVRGGYFAGHSIYKNRTFVQVPENEAKIRFAIEEVDRATQHPTKYPYLQLVGHIAEIAIAAENNKPLFGLRAPQTSSFYSNILDTLNINIDASLASIKKLILSKDKTFWGTRFHERPTTVNKILAAIDNDQLDNPSKLKKAILIANEASTTKSYLRSRNTDAFYAVFTSLLVIKTPQQDMSLNREYPQQPPRRNR